MNSQRKINIKAISVTDVLDQLGVSYSEDGKNVSSGWIGTQCPFCDDQTDHLGINLDSRLITCWKCGAKGSILRYMKEVTKSWRIVKDIARSCSNGELLLEEEDEDGQRRIQTVFPRMDKAIPKLAYRFLLEQRRYNAFDLRDDYDLHFTTCPAIASEDGIKSDFSYRIIAPVIERGVPMTYVGMDYTGNATIKYKACPEELSIKPTKECWYNIDSVTGTAIIVEGITDVWRMGAGAIASLGKKVTAEQLNLLVKFKINRAVVLFDADAEDTAVEFANDLSLFVDTKVVLLDEGDPDNLSDKAALKLKREILRL